MSVSAVLGVSLKTSSDETGTSSRTGMTLTVGFSGSSSVSVRLHSSLLNSGSWYWRLKL